jgi:hypothetical protein
MAAPPPTPARARPVAPPAGAPKRPADIAPGLAEKVLAHCLRNPEVTTRKGAKTFQVRVTTAGLTVTPPDGKSMVFTRPDLEKALRAILAVRKSEEPMTAANLEAHGSGPEGLYVWGILGHMNARPA